MIAQIISESLFFFQDDYYNADSIKRIELTKEMILTAVKRIITKVDFDYGKFKEDLISLH